MSFPRPERSRRFHHEFTSVNIKNDWASPSWFKIRTSRSVVMSGDVDLKLYGLEIKKALGVIELMGGRAGPVRPVLLVIFSDDPLANVAQFRLDDDYAVGSLGLPAAMFAGVRDLSVAAGAVFRISSITSLNAISTDAALFNEIGVA